MAAISTWSRRLKDRADHIAAAAWLALFSVLGHLRKRQVPIEPGSERVMVVAPHPDDEVLGCGGAILRHVARGSELTVVYVTDGRRSRARQVSPDEMASLRRREAQAAAAALGVNDIRWLGLPEGDWEAAELESRLATLLEEFAPETIYAPSRLDYHPEHRKVATGLAAVVSSDTRVRIYTLHIPFGFLVNRFVDVSEQLPQIAAAFDIYETQRRSLLRGLRIRRFAAAFNRCGDAAEEFVEVTGHTYRAAHVSDAVLAPVRGMRFRAFSDPLCYLIGWRARRLFARSLQAAGRT